MDIIFLQRWYKVVATENYQKTVYFMMIQNIIDVVRNFLHPSMVALKIDI